MMTPVHRMLLVELRWSKPGALTDLMPDGLDEEATQAWTDKWSAIVDQLRTAELLESDGVVLTKKGRDEADTVQIGDQRVLLRTPKSFTERIEVMEVAESRPRRAEAAAVALCWQAGPTSGRPKVSYASCGYDALVFGERALNEMMAAGAPLTDIVNAGAIAANLLVEGLNITREVQAAADFSGGPGGQT